MFAIFFYTTYGRNAIQKDIDLSLKVSIPEKTHKRIRIFIVLQHIRGSCENRKSIFRTVFFLLDEHLFAKAKK